MVSVGITKERDETPLEAALRYAKKAGLEREVQEEYDKLKAEGWSDERAAWGACWEWDVGEVFP